MKFKSVKNAITRRAQKGVTMIEYALIAALIAVAAIAALTLIGGDLKTTFGNVSTSLQGAKPAP